MRDGAPLAVALLVPRAMTSINYARIPCAELIERADLAARQGDLTTLVRALRLIASRVGDPISDKLRVLARSCDDATIDPRHAWSALRTAIMDRIEIAGT